MAKSNKPDNTIQSHLEAAGVSRRGLLAFVFRDCRHRSGGIGADEGRFGRGGCGQDRKGAATVGHLAALSGLHGMHGDAAADIGAGCRPPDPRHDFSRLPRDADGGFGRAGRSRAAARR